MLFPLPLSITMWPEMLDFYGENANDFLNLPLHLGIYKNTDELGQLKY